LGNSLRASRTVHSWRPLSVIPVAMLISWHTKRQSNAALCATNTLPRSAAETRSATCANRGWSATIACVIPVSPVISAGIGRSGFTSVQ
jgi:hypothetical protein